MSSIGSAVNQAATSSLPQVRVSPAWSNFEAFYRAEVRGLERALVLAIGDVELGRDAAAEGFARALQRWRVVARYENPTGWVYRVGLNWALSRRRRQRRDADHRHAAPSGVEVVTALSGDVTEALLALSPEQRAVVVARHVLDWSEAEVAAALGIPLGTVKSRLSRALARLAEMLEDPHGTTH